jgi:endoglycosylceramidase
MATDAAANGAGTLPPLVANGQWLTTKEGEVVILRGVNLVSKTCKTPEELGFDESSAQLLQDHGFSVVRLGVLWCNVEPYLMPNGTNEYETDYLASLKRTIELLSRHGIYTLVDFHQDAFSVPWGYGAPLWALACVTGTAGAANGGVIYQRVGFPNVTFGVGANTGANAPPPTETDCDLALDAFWQNQTVGGTTKLWTQYGDMIQFVAWFFHDRAGDILGYDPINEPTPGSFWTEALPPGPSGEFPNGCPTFDQDYLQPFYQYVIPRLREAHPEAIVWFEPNPLFGLDAPTFLVKPDFPNVGFNFHNYNSTSYEPSPVPQVPPPIQYSQDFQKTYVVPLLCSEYGATTDPDYVTAYCDLNDQHMLSSIYWTYFNNARFVFAPTGGQLPPDPRSQGIVRNMAAPLAPPNLNIEILEALTRVYPRIIAGTPSSFSYNPGTQVFNLTYSTRMVAGSAPRSVTSIVVPACLYPSGYTVKVTNGTSVQFPGRLEVTARASPGGTTTVVTVTISSA